MSEEKLSPQQLGGRARARSNPAQQPKGAGKGGPASGIPAGGVGWGTATTDVQLDPMIPADLSDTKAMRAVARKLGPYGLQAILRVALDPTHPRCDQAGARLLEIGHGATPMGKGEPGENQQHHTFSWAKPEAGE